MKDTKNIQGNRIRYDAERTSDSYLKEMNIMEDCPCGDCFYFATTVTKMDFEIFRILKEAGVDLQKNLGSEPTGIWCIREDNGELMAFQQVYLIKGTTANPDENSFLYEKQELGFSITARISQAKTDTLVVDLQVAKLEE